MHTFKVWAPIPKKVSVKVNGSTHAMHGPDEQGWWRLDVEEAASGADYCFLLDDDDKCYPDPQSLWQPDGVHGPSRVYDQSAFSWTDGSFKACTLDRSVVYELHIGTFTAAGTLDAAIEKLDNLLDLGITHVELMPVAAFAGDRGWGYDGVALFAVHQAYGGPDALKHFVAAAHNKGLAVLLDVVYNHFGPVGNYTGKFGPYLTEAHRTPWGGAVNLEEEWSDEVRRFFCDNALMWLRDYHFDGLRLDAVHALVDRSAVHFLEQLSGEVAALSASLDRPLVVIAESDLNDPRFVVPRDDGGLGMDAQWSDDFHHALFALLAPDSESGGYYADFGKLSDLVRALEQSFVFDGQFSHYRNRTHGRSAAGIPQHRFLGYIQNHDQVGNRAIGDRLQDVVGFERAKVAAAVVLLSPFVPMIFQGEEWAASSPFLYFADHDDAEMARLVAEGRRREFAAFGWPPDAIPDPANPETFRRSILNWSEAAEDRHAEMRAWYQALIHLRRSTPSLNNSEAGATHVSYDDAKMTFRMTRGSLTLACNLGVDACEFALSPRSKILLSSNPSTATTDDRAAIAPDSVLVVSDPSTVA